MPRFTEETKKRIDELVSRYPTKQAALIPSLWVAQEVYGGWLPPEAMEEVARYLSLPPAEVAGVATFYTMFNKEPVGKHHIEICHNVSCLLMGAEQVIRRAEEKLGVAKGGTTADGAFTLAGAECLGACCNAPAVQVGPRYFENVTPAGIEQIIDDLRDAPSEVASPAQARMPEMTRF